MSEKRFSFRIVESSDAPVLTAEILARISARQTPKTGFLKSVLRRFSRWIKPRKQTPADSTLETFMQAALSVSDATIYDRIAELVSMHEVVNMHEVMNLVSRTEPQILLSDVMQRPEQPDYIYLDELEVLLNNER